jgi:beta-hydroxylase
MGKLKNNKKSLLNSYTIVISIIVVILFVIFEHDRKFSDGGKGYNLYFYYVETFPMPIVGLYNTIIRLTNQHHSHIFDVNNFNSNKILKNNWKIIQKEALNMYHKKDKLLNMRDIGAMDNFSRVDAEPNMWKVFVLKWYDKPLENAKRLCPETVKLIDECKDVHAAMFSILEPGKYVPPHKGPWTACLRYHLGLKIPNDVENCYIKVNNHKYTWSEGESFIFDDTYEHSVYNNTNECRIILFVDIERPLPFPVNKLNKYLCKNVSFHSFVKGVNDVSEKTVELFHTR